MKVLALYNCDSCGFLGTKNFRDESCPVCKVAGKVTLITLRGTVENWVVAVTEPAPHVYEQYIDVD